jgi:hypothetical protein
MPWNRHRPTRRRALLALAAVSVGLVTATGAAAPAQADPAVPTAYTFTLDPTLTRGITDNGIWVVPLPPATATFTGTGTGRQLSIRLPVTGPADGSFPQVLGGGVWFIGTRTGRNASFTQNRLTPSTSNPAIAELSGAVSSRGGQRGTWAAWWPQYAGPNITGGDSLLPVLSDLAGVPLAGGGPFALIGTVAIER